VIIKVISFRAVGFMYKIYKKGAFDSQPQAIKFMNCWFVFKVNVLTLYIINKNYQWILTFGLLKYMLPSKLLGLFSYTCMLQFGERALQLPVKCTWDFLHLRGLSVI
jgi:hypothetical protein